MDDVPEEAPPCAATEAPPKPKARSGYRRYYKKYKKEKRLLAIDREFKTFYEVADKEMYDQVELIEKLDNSAKQLLLATENVNSEQHLEKTEHDASIDFRDLLEKITVSNLRMSTSYDRLKKVIDTYNLTDYAQIYLECPFSHSEPRQLKVVKEIIDDFGKYYLYSIKNLKLAALMLVTKGLTAIDEYKELVTAKYECKLRINFIDPNAKNIPKKKPTEQDKKKNVGNQGKKKCPSKQKKKENSTPADLEQK